MATNSSLCQGDFVEMETTLVTSLTDKDTSTCVKTLEFGATFVAVFKVQDLGNGIRFNVTGKNIDCHLLSPTTDYASSCPNSNGACGTYGSYCVVESTTDGSSGLTQCVFECPCDNCTKLSVRVETVPSVNNQINWEICEIKRLY